MTTNRDRILGTARGGWAWFLCILVLGIAAFSAVGWFRWGDTLYLVAAAGFTVLAVTGMLRLRKISVTEKKERAA